MLNEHQQPGKTGSCLPALLPPATGDTRARASTQKIIRKPQMLAILAHPPAAWGPRAPESLRADDGRKAEGEEEEAG